MRGFGAGVRPRGPWGLRLLVIAAVIALAAGIAGLVFADRLSRRVEVTVESADGRGHCRVTWTDPWSHQVRHGPFACRLDGWDRPLGPGDVITESVADRPWRGELYNEDATGGPGFVLAVWVTITGAVTLLGVGATALTRWFSGRSVPVTSTPPARRSRTIPSTPPTRAWRRWPRRSGPPRAGTPASRRRAARTRGTFRGGAYGRSGSPPSPWPCSPWGSSIVVPWSVGRSIWPRGPLAPLDSDDPEVREGLRYFTSLAPGPAPVAKRTRRSPRASRRSGRRPGSRRSAPSPWRG